MKKIQLTLLMLFVVVSGISAQSGKNHVYLKPTHYQKKIVTKVSGKSRNYYYLSSEKPSKITVEGPGKLMVVTRGTFVPNEKGIINYKVVYSIDGAPQKMVRATNIERSKEASYLNDSTGVPGQSKSFEIVLGRGSHTITFKLKETLIPVAALFLFKPTKVKKQDWVMYSPKIPSEPVDLITKEEIVTYYRFSAGKPLVVEVNGPAELQVLTRIENHCHMKGRIKYRVQVKENGKVMNTYMQSSVRSQVTVYKNNQKLIPGKACEFVINIPKGKHVYEILPLDQDKTTLLGRLLLPEKDVKTGK